MQTIIRARGFLLFFAATCGALSIKEHQEGIAHEHDSLHWPLAEGDVPVIKQILEKLNEGSDIRWIWKNTSQSWFYGLVKITDPNPKISLALHMIHRHGLGPLLAAKAVPKPEASDDPMLVTEAIENLDEVQLVRGLMEQMSLSGLRNLHSFDHRWSVEQQKAEVPFCYELNPSACVLQAGFSKKAHCFMVQHGFKGEALSKMKDSLDMFEQGVYETNGQKTKSGGEIRSLRNGYLTPQHTGNMNTSNSELSADGKILSGRIEWEHKGSAYVHIEMTAEEQRQMEAAPSESKTKQNTIASIVERHFEEEAQHLREYVQQNKMKYFAGEEAQFVEMYSSLPAGSPACEE